MTIGMQGARHPHQMQDARSRSASLPLDAALNQAGASEPRAVYTNPSRTPLQRLIRFGSPNQAGYHFREWKRQNLQARQHVM